MIRYDRINKKTNYVKPAYHAEGFGKKTTKPPWYSTTKADPSRKPVDIWENPRNMPLVEEKGAPFILDSDPRLYRPTVPSGKKEVEATPRSRCYVSAAAPQKEIGIEEKKIAMRNSYIQSRMQMKANLKDARASEVKDIIYGQADIIKTPTLFPQKIDHQIGLALEKKVGPKPFWDQMPSKKESSGIKWNQDMYVAYSRTRSDFPYLNTLEQPYQEGFGER